MLAPVDVAALKQLAALRPTARLHFAPRDARFRDLHLRAAFAVLGLGSAPAHFQPCQRCGLCTASWCEACEPALAQGPPPVAICTACDTDHLVCAGCEAKGSTWETAIGLLTCAYTRRNSLRRHRASGSRRWLLKMERSTGARPPSSQVTDEDDLAFRFRFL